MNNQLDYELELKGKMELMKATMVLEYHSLNPAPNTLLLQMRYAKLKDSLKNPSNLSKSMCDLMQEGLIDQELCLYIFAFDLARDLFDTVQGAKNDE